MGQHRRTADDVAQLVGCLGAGPWTRAQVLSSGWTSGQVRRAVEAGRLVRRHRGVLELPGGDLVSQVRSVLLTASPRAVVSHATAAALHGLWLPAGLELLVHLTVPGDADDVRHGTRTHGSGLAPRHVVELDGIPVTSPARTAIDVARGRSLPDALLVLDSVARLELRALARTQREQRLPEVRDRATGSARDLLVEAYEAERTWPGTAIVRAAIPRVDAASESAFESWSRGQMLVNALPAPALGVQVSGASGRDYWSDFGWPDAGVVGEADGLGKYGGTEQQVRASVRAERLRQADLEGAGLLVVRWSSAEPPREWLRRLRRALDRA